MAFKKGDPNNPGFKKGQVANPGGRPKSRLLSLLRDKLAKPRENVIGPNGKVIINYEGKTNEELIVDKLLTLAIDLNDREALKYVFDRIEGKMKDTMEMTGSEGTPMKFSLVLGDKGND